MVEWLRQPAGDPGRIHAEGMAARAALEAARESVARLVGTRSRQVIFTSGATEAIAAAVWGATARAQERRPGVSAHHVVGAVEHSAVREATARAGSVTFVPVDRAGRVDPDRVDAAIGSDTVAVHVQWANHEVGTIQPVAAIADRCHQHDVLFHVDAAQAAGHVPVAFDELGADLMSISGHKLGAPAGTGALVVRRGLRVPPLLVGGAQERARRAGLENVAALVGLGAAAAELAVDDGLAAEVLSARRLTERVVAAANALDGVEVYGDPTDRVPHLVCLGTHGVEPQAVLLELDRAGIAAHSGSACASEGIEPSPVLEAMGVDAQRSLRISVGWNTTDADIDALLDALPGVLDRLRSLRSGWEHGHDQAKNGKAGG